MFRNRCCASVTTELSNALAVWTCDSRGPAPNTSAFALGSEVRTLPLAEFIM
jgi:hypothetical protein